MEKVKTLAMVLKSHIWCKECVRKGSACSECDIKAPSNYKGE